MNHQLEVRSEIFNYQHMDYSRHVEENSSTWLYNIGTLVGEYVGVVHTNQNSFSNCDIAQYWDFGVCSR